jgi:hypothetical protein
MKQENVDINIGSKLDAKGFKQAETALGKLGKTVKSAAAAVGIAYGARAITQFGIASVKAFAADDKAAKVLGQTLNNLGLGFGNNAQAVNNYISGLEKQTGVLDDELRPAMDRLLRATGDITKSQQLLSLALDISAGTGKSLTQVSQSLQKGYLGQTQALGRLGVGLSKAELTSSTFEEIQARLTELFEGQATEAANTYAGSLDKLTVAGNNAKEVIGKGLTEALANLGGGGEGGLKNTLRLIELTSTALGNFIRKFGLAAGVTGQLFTGDLSGAKALIAAEANRGKTGGGITPAIAAELKKAAAEKASLKVRTALVKTTKDQTKAIKEQTALQKAGTLFDLEQTQVIAALKGNISADERKRLELQLAILTGNTTEASKLAGQLAYSQGLTKELVAFLKNLPDAKNPFSAWASYLDAIEAQVKRIAVGGTTGGGTAAVTGTSMSNGNGMFDPSDFLPQIPGGKLGAGFNQPGTVIVNVAGSVVSEGELVDAVRNGLINSSLSGAGSLVARRTGTFATL